MPIKQKTKLKMTVPPGMSHAQAQELLLRKVQTAHVDMKRIKENAEELVDQLLESPFRPSSEGEDTGEEGDEVVLDQIRSIGEGVAWTLSEIDIPASWEEPPGFVQVDLPNGNHLSVGTANGGWGYDIVTDDGQPVEPPPIDQKGWESIARHEPALTDAKLLASLIQRIYEYYDAV